jgi:hypothetical protein
MTRPNGCFVAALSYLERGSLTVMVPSLHASCKRYRWLPGQGPDYVLPAPAPRWVVEPPQPRAQVVPVSVDEPIPEGERHPPLQDRLRPPSARLHTG